jgi:glycosyltransferase involved in cell wall biosynthesis
MKVMLLGAGSAIHTRRWADGLAAAGVEVVCVSQHDFMPGPWDARVLRERLPGSGVSGYFTNARALARLYARQRCDLLNAHYATGYGVLATASGVRPRLVSVWGSDVYDFPAASPLHRALLRRVLVSADRVASTSRAMARQVGRVVGAAGLARPVAVTPFGVDTDRFAPLPADEAPSPRPLVVGTVKVLAPKYGIDTLIRAFALLDPASQPGPPPLLRLVGDGPQRSELEALARRLGVADRVRFAGAVPHERVPAELRGFDVYAAASRLDSESFGVAVIEASACGLPVAVTRVGGLPEVVREGETGLVVERDDPPALAAALARLLGDAALRRRLGDAGRAWVRSEYEWKHCVERMIEVYRGVAAP